MKNTCENEDVRLRELLATLIHDIRSPLTCLMVWSMMEELTPDKRQSIDRSIDRIKNIIDSADKSLINKDAPSDGLINVALILENIILEKKQEYFGYDINFEYTKPKNHNEIDIRGSIDDLSRALSNLLNNAVEACKDRHGIITIELTREANFISLSITDNGKGIPAEVLQKLRSGVAVTYGKQNGRGIGFCQITAAVNKLNGEIAITSTLGSGTKIIIEFKNHYIS